jgi:predicted RNase H-like nuclease
MSAPVAIGADGITGGWAVAACRVERGAWARARAAREVPAPSARRVELHRAESVESIVELRQGGGAVVALDIPLGLPEQGGARPCDEEARRHLGKGASSVFNPPARYLFPTLAKEGSKDRWREAQRLVKERRREHPEAALVGVNRQTLGILDKVAEADSYLCAHPEAQAWLLECHPEVSFLRLNGGERLASKSKARGALDRLALIEREFPLAESTPLADLLDAHAALWTALRVAARAIDPERDALGRGPDGSCPRADGLLMRIVA